LSIVRQQALTLATAIVPGREAELDTWLRDNRRALQRALERSSTTHFARWVILPPSRDEDGQVLGERHLLAFESNFDGQLEQHLADLRGALGSLLDGAFAHAEGYPGSSDARELEQFFRRGALRAAAFYVAHGGLPVGVIQGDAALKQAVERRLSERSRGAHVQARDALELAEDLQRVAREVATERGLTLGHVERGLRPSSSSMAMAALRAALSQPFGVLLALVLAPFFEWRDAVVRRRQPSFRDPALQQKRDGIGLEEDRVDQNGLTHLVPIKPGRYRSFALKMMVLVVTGLADFGAQVGRLGEIETIHFARWVVLPDRRLLFFSNYDGSWEAYLGDFIDKASKGLTMIWTNTLWFPRTRLLLFKGARDEGAFKQWTRAYQVPTQVWYSAYPFSSVADVLKNARIRELLGSALDQRRSEELLALL
jgi:hypothetical protein